ncbi:MAG: aminoacyl-tRNA hydrolase [Anaerolineae bacterium]|nr:aminoacyl-tRNA hydrolase [Anaerolineae bacterium]
MDRGCARALVVGLGNPGATYARHRHNVGFFIVDALARAHGLSFARDKDARAHVATGQVAGTRVILAKPQTYMNLSGRTAGRLLRAHGVPIECLLVVYDDLDLPLGRLRLRAEGGSGGHKGMRSIQEVLGTQSFPRLRVGIDRPPAGVDPADYVLQPFAASDRPLLDAVVDRAVTAVECWLAEGVTAAMDRFNQPFLEESDGT